MASFAHSFRQAARTLPAVACAAAGVGSCKSTCSSETLSNQDKWAPRFTCFGEAMIRYVPDPEGGKPASQFAARWLRSAGGAELNISVALSRLGWGDRTRWVSVVPEGVLGDDFLQVLGQAYPDGKGERNLSLVRRESGDVGIYHVWPAEHKIWFQRRNSTFGLMDPGWFSRSFWLQTLAPSIDQQCSTPHVLHVTGITPLISKNTRMAWIVALETARTLKEDRKRKQQGQKREKEIESLEQGKANGALVVTMDLNHRPALGTWQELWHVAEPHIGTLDVLVFSIGDVIQVGKLFGEPMAEEFQAVKDKAPGLKGAPALDEAVRRSVATLQRSLGYRTNIAVTCKVRDPVQKPGTPPTQLRWSVVCLKDGTVISTLDTAVLQQVREEIGGGDSWLSGLIDGLVGSPVPGSAAPNWTAGMWRAAMQRGDCLAALKQEVLGDFSNIERPTLEAKLAKHSRA